MPKTSGRVFVVHEHFSRTHHFDLRLEKDGVLKSWAVPKEPPIEEGIKRLAVQVEDHALEYGTFEGEIPEGEYGAGKVEIWDEGKLREESWKPEKIVVELQGKKLKGKYVLVKTRFSEKSWLFFKKKGE